MYIKRDQSWRLSSGSVEPPVMQRRSSLRPHNKVPSAVKNEAHPLVKPPEACYRQHSSNAEASYHLHLFP